MKSGGSAETSKALDKAKNETSTSNAVPAAGVNYSATQDNKITTSDHKDLSAFVPVPGGESVEVVHAGVPGLPASVASPSYDPTTFQAQPSSYTLANKNDAAASVNPYLAGGLDASSLPSSSVLNTNYMLYGDGSAPSQQMLMMSQSGQSGIMPQQGSNWQPSNTQGGLKSLPGKEGGIVAADLDQGAAAIYKSHYNSYLYNLQQQQELQQQYNAALGLPVQLNQAGSAAAGTSGPNTLTSSAGDLSVLQQQQQPSYLYSQPQSQQAGGVGMQVSSPQYYMPSSGSAVSNTGTPSGGSSSSKASKKNAAAAAAAAAAGVAAQASMLGMSSYYSLPMNMTSSQDLTNAAGSVPIGSVINGLPSQHQMSMMMNPALMNTTLGGGGGGGGGSGSAAGGAAGGVGGTLSSQHLMNQTGGPASYMTAPGSTPGGANAGYFLNNTMLLSNATGGRTQTTPSSGGASKVDVLGGNRLLLQQGTTSGSVGPYANMTLAQQQQQMYNLGLMAPQLGGGMGLPGAGGGGSGAGSSSSGKKAPSSLYNQIVNKNPVSPYNPLAMNGAMGYPGGALGPGDMMGGVMLSNPGGMMMKPTLQRASSTGSVSKSKKSKQSSASMSNLFGAGVVGMTHAPSLWEQIQPQPINSQASQQMQMMQSAGLQSQMQQAQQQQQQQSMQNQMPGGQPMTGPSSAQGLMQTSSVGGSLPGGAQMNPPMGMSMMGPTGGAGGGGGGYMTGDGMILQQRHELAAQMAQQAVYGVGGGAAGGAGAKGGKQPKEGKREARPSKAKGKDKNNGGGGGGGGAVMGQPGGPVYVNANGMMATGDGLYAMMGGHPAAGGPGGMPPGVVMQGVGVPGMKEGAMGIKLEGGMTGVSAVIVPPAKPTKEEGVTALNKRRESVVSKLLMLENSKTLGRRSVAVPVQAPPGGRRKVHGDYLMDEMQFLAIDFRQELRTKMAVLKSVAAACAEAVVLRRTKSLMAIASASGEEYVSSRDQAKQAAGKMSQMVANCWSAAERQILSQLHGKGNLKSLESVSTKLRDELFLPRVKTLLAQSTDIKDLVCIEAPPALLPYASSAMVPSGQSEVVVTKTQANSIDRTVDRAIDKILKAKQLVVTVDPTEASGVVKMDISDEEAVQLLPHQEAVIDGILKLSLNLSFGSAVLAKQSAGITTALCSLIHNNWLPSESVESSSVAATSASDGTSDAPDALPAAPLPMATVVVVITPRKRLFKWLSCYTDLYSSENVVHYKPNGSESDNKITPTSLEKFVMLVCAENITNFMESALFSHFLHSQQLCGVMVDLRGSTDVKLKGNPPNDNAGWMVSLANQLNANRSIYRTTVSSVSYSMSHYDVPSLLAFLVPQITYASWCNKYPINKGNLVALDADGDFLHTDIINRNTVNQLICNISVHCKVLPGAEQLDKPLSGFVEEILEVEMSREQSFKYHAISSLLVNESTAEVCEPQTIANAVVLLQRVCFHEQFVSVYDVDSKWYQYESYHQQPLLMGAGGYGYSPNMFMGVPYANALSPHFGGQQSAATSPGGVSGSSDGVYLSSSRFSFTNQQQFQTAIYSPQHPSTAATASAAAAVDVSGSLQHSSSSHSPMLLSGMYGNASGMMMSNAGTVAGSGAAPSAVLNSVAIGSTYVIPRHMSFDNNLNSNSVSTSADAAAAAAATSTTAAATGMGTVQGSSAHPHPMMLQDVMTHHHGHSYSSQLSAASSGSFSPRRKPKNFAFYQSSAIRRLRTSNQFDFVSGSTVSSSSKLKSLVELLAQQFESKILVLVQEAEELAVVHQHLVNERIKHLLVSTPGSQSLVDQETVHQFNRSSSDSCKVLLTLCSVFSQSSSDCVVPSGSVVDTVVILSSDWISASSTSAASTTLSVVRNHLSVSALSRTSYNKSPVKIVQIVARNTLEEVMARRHASLLSLQGLALEELHLSVPSDVIVDQSSPTRAGLVAAGKQPFSLASKTFLAFAPAFSAVTAKNASSSSSATSVGGSIVSAVVVSPDRNTPIPSSADVNKPRSSGFGGKGTILLGPQGTTTFMKSSSGAGGQVEGPSSPMMGVKPRDNSANGEKEAALKWLQSLKECRDAVWKEFGNKNKIICSKPTLPVPPPVEAISVLEHKARSDSQSSELAALTNKFETSSSTASTEGGVATSTTSVESSAQAAAAAAVAVSVSSEEPEECLESCNTRIFLSVLQDSLSTLTGHAQERGIERVVLKDATEADECSRHFTTGSQLADTVSRSLMTSYVSRLTHEIDVVESNITDCPCNNSYDFLMSDDIYCNSDRRKLFSSLERSRLALAASTRCHVVSPVQRCAGGGGRVPNLLHYLQPVQNRAYHDDLIDSDQLPFPRCVYTYGEVLSEYQRKGETMEAQLFVCPLVTACRGDTVVVPYHNTTTCDVDDTYNNVTLKYLLVKNGPKNGQNGGISATNRKYRQAYTKKKSGGDASSAQNADAGFALDGSLQDLGPLDSDPLMDYFGASSGGGGIAFSQDFGGYDPSMFGSILSEGDLMTSALGGGGGSSSSTTGKRLLTGPDGSVAEGGSPAPAPKKRKTAAKKGAATTGGGGTGTDSQAMLSSSQDYTALDLWQYNAGRSDVHRQNNFPDSSLGHTTYDQLAAYSGSTGGNVAPYASNHLDPRTGGYNHSSGGGVGGGANGGGGGSFSDSLSSTSNNPATYNSYRAAVSGSAPLAAQQPVIDTANEGGWFSIEDDLIICMQNAVNDDDFTRTETWLKKSNSKRGIGKVRTAEEAKSRYKVLCDSGIKDRRLLDHKVIGTISTLKKSIQQNINKQERQLNQQQAHSQHNSQDGNEGGAGGGSESSVIVNLTADLH